MAGILSSYDPLMYANEALEQMFNVMGMSRRVFRGYDEERRSFNKGGIIDVRVPGKFTVQDAPGTAEEINASNRQFALDRWKTVKFKINDKDMAHSDQRIIDEHIRPAAMQLAEHTDNAILEMKNRVANTYSLTGAPGSDVAHIIQPRKVLFQNKVPMNDVANIHYAVGTELEAGFLGLPQFTQYDGSGDRGTAAQITGSLGQRFGMNFWATQNIAGRTPTALVGSPLVNGAAAAGVKALTWDAGTLTGSVNAGDTFTIAGSTQVYAITTDATASGNAVAVAFEPPLAAAAADNAAITLVQTASDEESLAFHRDAFLLAMAPLPETGRQMGDLVSTVTNSETNLALRARMYSMPDLSEMHVSLDILYCVDVLRPELACRVIDPT